MNILVLCNGFPLLWNQSKIRILFQVTLDLTQTDAHNDQILEVNLNGNTRHGSTEMLVSCSAKLIHISHNMFQGRCNQLSTIAENCFCNCVC